MASNRTKPPPEGRTRQDAGWYTRHGIGSVCREDAHPSRRLALNGAGWYFWPYDEGADVVGPFKTRAEAMAEAERSDDD